MANVLYWVRHGESESNVRREYATWRIDLPLTEKGRLQARQTAGYFQGMGITEIYCSPLQRALETAEIIGTGLVLPVTPMTQFREVSVGELEGLPINETNRGPMLQVRRAWQAGDLDARVPGGESYRQIWSRMLDGLRRVLDGKDGRRIVIVSHMVLLGNTLKALCPDVDEDLVRRQESFNCSVTEVTLGHDGKRWVGHLVRWADISHLSEEAADLISFTSASGKREA